MKISSLSGISNTSLLLGTSVGAIVEIPMNGILSLRAEPSYIQKGTDVTVVITNSNTNASWSKLRSQYLQIPVELKAILPMPLFTPHIFFGPNVGYLLSAKAESFDAITGQEFDGDVKHQDKNVDFAIDFGAGLDYSITPLIKANFDLKYSLGLMNIDNTSTGAVYTRGFQMFVGVLFSI